MPLLSYTSSNFPFQPFSKIYSADIDQCFNDIKTLLNTTGLNYLNVQVHGLRRNGSTSNMATGTANAVVINDSNGDMSEIAPGSSLQVLQMNSGATGLQFGPSPPSAVNNVYAYQNYV